MKRYSTYLAIRKSLIKAIMWDHYTPVIKDKIKKLTISTYGKDWDQVDLLYIVDENAKWNNHSGKQFVSFFFKNKVMRILTIWFSS